MKSYVGTLSVGNVPFFLYEAVANLLIVMMIAGHTDNKTTVNIYTHASDEIQITGVKKNCFSFSSSLAIFRRHFVF